MELSKAIREFLEYCEIEKGLSKRTIDNYADYLHRFLAFCDKNEITQTEMLTYEVNKRYRLKLNINETMQKNTQNYHLIAIRNFLKYCQKNNISALSPEKIELAKVDERVIEHLSAGELANILSQIDTDSSIGLRDRTILEVLFSTGLRIHEIVSLDVEQVKNNELTISGKGGKARLVF
ncbi:MAG: putative Tyrosine recombinase xerD, partial [Candidatus Berkelbacteria bacterium Licking1014_85]